MIHNILFRFLGAVLLITAGIAPAIGSGRADIHYHAYSQMTLLHRITKSTCLVMLGVDSDVHKEDIRSSSKIFLQQAQSLRKSVVEQMSREQIGSTYNPDQGVGLETILDDIDRIYYFFSPILDSARQILGGDMHSSAVHILMERAAHTSHDFQTLARKYEIPSQRNPLRNALNQTLNQRMLSQQMLRDICFLRAGFHIEKTRTELSKNIPLFSNNLTALIYGDSKTNIPKAANVQIKLKLQTTKNRWDNLASLLDKLLNTEYIITSDIQLASVMGDSVQHALDQVLYEFSKLPPPRPMVYNYQ